MYLKSPLTVDSYTAIFQFLDLPSLLEINATSKRFALLLASPVYFSSLIGQHIPDAGPFSAKSFEQFQAMRAESVELVTLLRQACRDDNSVTHTQSRGPQANIFPASSREHSQSLGDDDDGAWVWAPMDRLCALMDQLHATPTSTSTPTPTHAPLDRAIYTLTRAYHCSRCDGSLPSASCEHLTLTLQLDDPLGVVRHSARGQRELGLKSLRDDGGSGGLSLPLPLPLLVPMPMTLQRYLLGKDSVGPAAPQVNPNHLP